MVGLFNMTWKISPLKLALRVELAQDPLLNIPNKTVRGIHKKCTNENHIAEMKPSKIAALPEISHKHH